MLKYDQLYQEIVADIKEGRYSFGEKLPSENMLCIKCKLSRQTVRNALEKLEKEHFIERIKGKGSYVIYDCSTKEQIPARKKIIGVSLSFLDNYIFPTVLIGIEETLQRAGYGILLGLGHNRVQNEADFLKKALAENVSGIIMEGIKSTFPNPNEAYYQELKRQKIPVVFVNNYYRNVETPSIIVDDTALTQEITQLLIDRGHKKIAGIFKFDDIQGPLRYNGYVRALLKNNLDLFEDYIGWYDSTSSESSNQKLNKYLDQYTASVCDWCTAIVCYNDLIAGKIAKRLRKLGKRIPEDISIAGFDNSDVMRSYGINLTSVHHPKEEMGIFAAQTLLKYIEEKPPEAFARTHIVMPSRIVPRDSICDIRELKDSRASKSALRAEALEAGTDQRSAQISRIKVSPSG